MMCDLYVTSISLECETYCIVINFYSDIINKKIIYQKRRLFF